MARGGVVPVRKRGLWAFVYAGAFDGLRGGKVFSTDWGPSTSEEQWCGAASPGNQQNPDERPPLVSVIVNTSPTASFKQRVTKVASGLGRGAHRALLYPDTIDTLPR